MEQHCGFGSTKLQPDKKKGGGGFDTSRRLVGKISRLDSANCIAFLIPRQPDDVGREAC